MMAPEEKKWRGLWGEEIRGMGLWNNDALIFLKV
jgi:hypothetical protein